jgi:DNA-binding transcriptional ArsR family regulator
MPRKLTEKWLARTFDEVISRRPLPKENHKFREIREELVCLQGRPDFAATTAANLPDRTTRASFASALGLPSRARIVSLLSPNKWTTSNDISRNSGLSIRTVRTGLARLARANVVIASPTQGYRLAKDFESHMIELWAFELKLGDWKRALYQTLQYKAFAHRVAIVMSDRDISRLRPYVATFRKNGIGVYAINLTRNRVRVLLQPVRHIPASRFHYVYAVGQFLNPKRKKASGHPASRQSRRRRARRLLLIGGKP